MKKILSILKIIFIVLLSLFAIIFVLRFVIGGSEDDWICVKGEWVKHGYPSALKPVGECKK